jgi:peroxiredoxin
MGKSDLGEMVPKAERSSASTFSVQDVQGKTFQVSELKGKILVVGFWQTTCGPSINLLNELADYQVKGEKFNFEVWPVSMDDAKWSAILPFANKNRKFLEKTRLYLPSIGATGPSVFMNILPVLPALFILDKDGKVAFKMMGYEPNALVNALKKIITEK